ncbi:ATP-binding protein [Singulisphaera acidiphila]|uniref:ATPase (AAA+ superfamily) n=1 Tax=Singulisphaera acidiphila (strain ATCC BAA-1392 / DSM 18658 / VKM B-2454 / MOB10) TaxID=886293 RepID=L0DGS4_SINAD|nr:hypothetical protein [Singulisphaera acidiphila]AGA28584.1 hypothetical protein Sinac_4393 [Singulisphaera acidiphila DSM 18658]
MKANPGGVVDPRNVYGRDRLISGIWDQLDRLCLLMNAERRIGKTSVLRKMKHEPAPGWFPVFLDLETFHSAEEFAIAVYGQVQTYLNTWKKAANAARKIYEDHEFGDFKRTSGSRPWKALLAAAVRDLVSEKQDVRLVFLWDELPYMIDHIRRANGEQAAVEVLDTLRSLRQEYTDLRMVFSGSIGLHHVLESIRDGKMSSEPVNDMYAIEVPPLDMEDAIKLAGDLIQGENLSASDPGQAAGVIAEESDCFPFYIHHVVAGLRQAGRSAEQSVIRDLVQRQLVDANDPWDLGHYRRRIPAYYKKDATAQLVGLILDTLATAPDPLTVAQLQSGVNNRSTAFDSRDELVRVLRLMERDHYLLREPDGRIRFRFPLIRRWWALDRGI